MVESPELIDQYEALEQAGSVALTFAARAMLVSSVSTCVSGTRDSTATTVLWPDSSESRRRPFSNAFASQVGVMQGHGIYSMRVNSDAKGLECRMHMDAFDEVHDRC